VLKDGRFPPSLSRTDVQSLPESPGVYLFYGNSGELLYVGKSRNVRSRVLDHFANDQRSAKELEMWGALLLESQLIKELRPIYNTRSRRTRALILATRSTNKKGYTTVSIEAAERIEKRSSGKILAVFTSEKQAQATLRRMAKEYHLCYGLLGLERSRGYCFGYHLKQCLGACGGEEPPALYNERVEKAFGQRRVHSWPFPGGILIEERSPLSNEGEAFLLDDWCLLSTVRYSEHGVDRRVADASRFDYDTYKILLRYMRDSSNKRNMRLIERREIGRFLSEEAL
jgi:DNA polymerase-3 subunit epsilon